MSQKGNAWFTAGLISAVILIFTVADFLTKDRVFSETENRLLASKPEFTVEKLLEGSYSEAYETYVTDQFVSRDKWISLKTYWDVFLQKKEIGGVYLGADDYLIEQHLPEKYTDELVQKKLRLLKKLVDSWDAKVMLAPTADNILKDKMPANAPYFDEKDFLSQVEQTVGTANYIDAYAPLDERAEEYIYYRTDHHWTSLGAYYGYLSWAKAAGVTPYPYDVQAMETASEEFLGTLHSKVNLNWKPDTMQYFSETAKWPVKVTYDLQRVTDRLYEEKYLDTKNKYGFFMDDNHALVEIETGNNTGKTLFVIKDSYANCFVPLLLPHYDKVYVLDLRYYNGRLFPLLEQYKPGAEQQDGVETTMDVLVLYNCIHFLDDFVYTE